LGLAQSFQHVSCPFYRRLGVGAWFARPHSLDGRGLAVNCTCQSDWIAVFSPPRRCALAEPTSGLRPSPTPSSTVVRGPVAPDRTPGPRALAGPAIAPRPWSCHGRPGCPALWFTVPHRGLMVGGAPVICPWSTVICPLTELSPADLGPRSSLSSVTGSGPLGGSVR